MAYVGCDHNWDFGDFWLRCAREVGHDGPHRASKKLTEEVFQCPRCGGRPDRLKCGPGCGCWHHYEHDRRKGERRKGREWMGMTYGGPRTWGTINVGGGHIDRRSGKDRRKP